MTLLISSFMLGPLDNNTFLIADSATGMAAVVDPTFDCEPVVEKARRNDWHVTAILVTHAHFDHIAGAGMVHHAFSPQPELFLHPADLPLYHLKGSAHQFGFELADLPGYTQPLSDRQVFHLGDSSLEVRHTPGHSQGHVIFYCSDAGAVFCGDLVFAGSVGRTDLPGGSSLMLIRSIRHNILTLPPATRLLCGHGPETTVRDEIETNPYF